MFPMLGTAEKPQAITLRAAPAMRRGEAIYALHIAGDVPGLKHPKATLETKNSPYHVSSSPWPHATSGKKLTELDVAFHIPTTGT